MDAITPTILLLNLPPSALGGMDLLSFTTTPKFQGIKNIPPGLHFVFAGSTSTLSVRHGVWIKVSTSSTGPPDFFVRKWDSSSEDLVPETDVTVLLQQRANLGSIWRDNLTPYRQSASQDTLAAEEDSNRWIQLTDCISEAVLNRILDTNPEKWVLTSSSSAKQDFDDIPGLSSTDLAGNEQELHVLPIDLRQTWREGATGRERTEAAQDRSWALTDLITRLCANDATQIIGELQFCFAMVLTLNNYSCLEQWRRILNLVLTCTSAVTAQPSFFTRILATLKLQLQHGQDVETGLFDLSDDGATFLKKHLLHFKKSLDRLPGDAHAEVIDELDDLLAYAQETLGWQIQQGSFARTGMLSLEDGEVVEMDSLAFDEEEEEGEYAPAVVELTEQQMRELGIEDVGKFLMNGNKTPNLRERLRRDEEDGDGDEDEVESDDESEAEVAGGDYEDEEEMDLEDMDARY